MNTTIQIALALLGIDLAARFVVSRYYADSTRILRLLRLADPIEGEELEYHKPLDEVLAPLPFIWTWIEIVVPVMLAASVDHPLAWVGVVIWVGGRFRALQEFGHNAVHYALCRSRRWQWLLTDFFFQAPSFKTDIFDRQIRHTRQHHKNPNAADLDPNRTRVAQSGMTWPLTDLEFHLRLLAPLAPRRIVAKVRQLVGDSRVNHNRRILAVRVASVATVGLVLWAAGGWKGIVFGWLAPLVTTYSLFAWLALLAEHRWFVDAPTESDRLSIEYAAGRPTGYPGLAGTVVRILVSPTSDAYHLAHSLYPGIRWNYLPAIDRMLMVSEPRYSEHASQGLVRTRGPGASALSDLRVRLTSPHGPSDPRATAVGKGAGDTAERPAGDTAEVAAEAVAENRASVR